MAIADNIGVFVEVIAFIKPGPPTDFAIDGSPTSTGGDFTSTPPASAGSAALQGYNVYARTPQGIGSYTLILSTSSSNFTIDDSFTPATAYDLYLTAVTAHGNSVPSNVIQITTAA